MIRKTYDRGPSMLAVNNVSQSFADQAIVQEVSFVMNPGERRSPQTRWWRYSSRLTRPLIRANNYRQHHGGNWIINRDVELLGV